MKEENDTCDTINHEHGERTDPQTEEERRGVDHVVKWLSDN